MLEEQNSSLKVLKTICGSPDNPLKIGDIEIQCYVLEDETRVLTQVSLQKGIGMSASGSSKAGMHRIERLIRSLSGKMPELNVLADCIMSPIVFQPPHGGRVALGYEATILADICDAILTARKNKLLQKQQTHIADQCEILMRGFARVGIIALVDEVTGYQNIRARHALEQILKRYISEDLQRWVKTFPDDFYIQLFKLRGWTYSSITKRPGVAGRITVDIVYKRLAPGVLDELQKQTPRDDRGRLKAKLFQKLTPDYGHPKLREHIAAVTALMKASPNWRLFYSMLNRALPQYDSTLPLLLSFPEDESELK